MMKNYLIRICLLLTACTMLLTACGTQSAKLPDLSTFGKVIAISREEGSGTRAEFDTMLSTNESGADAVATSTNDVLQQVSKEKNAVGYLAHSTLPQELPDVKVLKVNGIEPDINNISSGKYALRRSYYLTHNGEMNQLQQDFLQYVLCAGQKLVAKKSIAVGTPTTFLSTRASGKLVINGSSSAAPLVKELAAEYMQLNPRAQVTVEVTDSSKGLTAAIRRECDFGISSRELKSYEKELLTANVFARDAIVLIVNKQNPINNLSTKQIKALYETCNEWKSLN